MIVIAFPAMPVMETITSLSTAITSNQPTATCETIMLFQGLLASWISTTFVLLLIFSAVCSTQFSTKDADGIPNQGKGLRRVESQLAPRDEAASLSSPTQTSLVTVTFGSNFTIGPITYTPSGIS